MAAIAVVLSKNNPLRNVSVVTTTGASSTTVPQGCSKYTGEVISSGGKGFGSGTTNQRAGGGGAQYAISNLQITVSAGSTLYYSVGAGATGAQDSWINTSNSAPSSATTGCLAKGGTNAASGTAGVGSTAGAIGSTTRVGANGTTGSTGRGGGASGASTAASGQTGGTDTTNITPTTMAGGNGGSSGGNPGVTPGGGGGGATTAGNNPNAGDGRARIRFYM